jgi:DNA mismatch repair protein MutS
MSKSKKPVEEDEKLHVDYLRYSKEYEEKYGKKSMVLMQCGSFFEVYSVMSLTTGEYIDNKILEFSEVCQMNIGPKKNVTDKNGQVVMAGFQTYLLDKYLPKLTDNGYTVVVYVQEKEKRKDGKYDRILDKVYSPGTYVCCDTDSSPKITNNIMCVWMHLSKPLLKSSSDNMSKIRETIVFGVSVVNIFTGKSSIFENRTTFLMNNTTFDELERYVSVYSPSEVIIISPFDDNDLQKIIQYSGITARSIHKVDTRDIKNQVLVNCENQRYIKQILTQFYSEETYDLCSEFNDNTMATQSFCYLLNFIREHNPDLVRKIEIPLFNNATDRVILANHTLLQLNIIDEGSIEDRGKGQYSSILTFLNKCCSSIGKRKFQYQITNPTFDEEWLNKEYDIVSKMLDTDNYFMVELFRKLLTKIKDIEKISRQIVLKKIYPSSIAQLYKTVDYVNQMNTVLYEMPDICDYLCDDFTDDIRNSTTCKFIDNMCSSICNFLNDKLIIDSCQRINSMSNFDINIIKKGVSDKLDEANDEYMKCIDTFMDIRNYLNNLMQKHEKSVDTEYIKIHETEKMGTGLQITNKRSKTMQTILNKLIGDGISSVNLGNNVVFVLSEVKFKSAGASAQTMDIEIPQLTQVCRRILQLKDAINGLTVEAYLKILNDIEEQWLEDLEKITKYISKIDVLQCKAYLAKQYNYCRPQIDNVAENSYANMTDIRHCLIEHLQQNEIYVTNDVKIGLNNKGILLYGTNAVGKTSLIRAIGSSIIMAQSGLFVPCSTFVFKPYTAIYSRILGNDNIFKGLSTFAVEMSELRIILKMADKNSLILGDELCSGTETESALSIFVAGLMELKDKESSFIFATHFHEILRYEEVTSFDTVSVKHMAVRYDRESDALIYDRKLRDGSGPRNYGLEVCKSLYLEDDFIELAYSLRNKYYPENKGSLSSPTTSYNAKKVKSVLCERCGENKAEEIHHLQQQKEADDNGFIGSFHKNHPANLEHLCQACHDKIHSDKTIKEPIVRKKTTKGYKIMTKD